MKRSLSLLLASLMLVFALTACGRRNDTPQDNSQTGNQNESAVLGGDSADSGNNNGSNQNGNGNAGNNNTNGENHNGNGSLLEDAGNAVEDGLNGMENAVDDMTDGTAKSRAGNNANTYNQKLNSTGTLMQNGNPVTFQNPVLPGIF